ncbi:tRNA synthetases class I (M)-domain-containing protein [Mycotypha africana]|uniref:tRNA synthetases class I (M)-domain-containing protein n=1 Tax=Mycotypha africana TaxID=64632 RepID=UPI0023014024|nr:tRNA synthetases class I (M)-domain-containing protein [Mycotypha africana]KAI8981719.1 tRNA synthetases class I (M)-domain-containing protein [Mycotypha africana]
MLIVSLSSVSRQAFIQSQTRCLHATRLAKHSKAFVTTPIYYVNAVPHIGHLYSTVLADTIRRNYALHGKEVIMSTGTDEHGLKIQQAAKKNNMQPIEFCDKVSESFRKLCTAANIEYTSFQRTTSPTHKKAVKELWNTLLKNGYLYKGKHEGWYAVSDEAFYAPNQVKEVTDEKTGEKTMVAIESGQKVEWMSEENYKFRLSLFGDKLVEWIDSHPTAIVPHNRRNEVLSWIKAGLADLSVSRLRSRLDWGIEVPNDPEHTIYVWLDALTNYLTATGYPWHGEHSSPNKEAFPPDVQIVGKDIVRFHAIYWPAFLMAADLPLPKQILAHAHWTMGKQKMSKSRGNVVDPFEVLDTYGVDPVRYYLVRDGGLADDGDYSEKMIKTRYKKDLAGQLGNLLNRTTAKSLLPSGVVPGNSLNTATVHPNDQMLHDQIRAVPENFNKAFEEREFNKAYAFIFDMLSQANKHFTENEPWKMTQNIEDKERLDTILFYSLEACRVAGILLQPIMPTKMESLLNQLGVPKDERYFKDSLSLKVGKDITVNKTEADILFPRLK